MKSLGGNVADRNSSPVRMRKLGRGASTVFPVNRSYSSHSRSGMATRPRGRPSLNFGDFLDLRLGQRKASPTVDVVRLRTDAIRRRPVGQPADGPADRFGCKVAEFVLLADRDLRREAHSARETDRIIFNDSGAFRLQRGVEVTRIGDGG